MKLKGIRYDLKKDIAYDKSKFKDEARIAKLESKRKNKIGFVAQDMVKVLPSAVMLDDTTGIYGIDYTRVIPVLVNAMQEQQAMIEQLQQELDNLKVQK